MISKQLVIMRCIASARIVAVNQMQGSSRTVVQCCSHAEVGSYQVLPATPSEESFLCRVNIIGSKEFTFLSPKNDQVMWVGCPGTQGLTVCESNPCWVGPACPAMTWDMMNDGEWSEPV